MVLDEKDIKRITEIARNLGKPAEEKKEDDERSDSSRRDKEEDSVPCPYCGAKLTSEVEYCPKCGEELDWK